MANSRSLIVRAKWLTYWLAPLRITGRASRRMALVLFLWGIGEGLWLYIRPVYVTQLGGTPAQAGQVLGVAGLAPVILMLPAGRLIDRIGPRRLMIVSWWIGTTATVILALATTWKWLIPGFFLYSVSMVAIPAVNAYVGIDARQQADGRDVSRVMQSTISAVFAAYFAGTIVSPMIGGWLGEHFGLRTVFWVSVGWFVLSTLTIQGAPDLRNPSFAETERPETWQQSVPWWKFSAAQLRIFGMLLLLFFFMSVGYTLVPNYLEEVRQLPIGIIGSLGAATALGGVVWLLLLGGRQSRTALAIASGLLALAVGSLLIVPSDARQLPAMIAVYFLLGIMLTVRTLSLGVVAEHAPVEQHGTSFGMIETLFGVGAFLGPWVAGMLFSQSPGLPFIVSLVALIPLSVLSWMTLRSPRR